MRSFLIAALAALSLAIPAYAQVATTVSQLPTNPSPTGADYLYVEHGSGPAGAGCPGTPTSTPYTCIGYKIAISSLPTTSGSPTGAAGGDLGGSYPNPTVISIADVSIGTLGVAHGGIGGTTLTSGGVLYGAGTSPIAATAAGSANNVLTSNGTIPGFQSVTSLLDSVFGSSQGDVLYRNATGWVALPPGTLGYVLTTGGASANVSWTAPTVGATISGTPTTGHCAQWASATALNDAGAACGGAGGPPTGAASGDLGSTYPGPTVVSVAHVTTGDLSVANGGTGAATFTAGGVLCGNGTSAIQATAVGTAAFVLTSNGSGCPTFQAPATNGTVTSIATNNGITGGTITNSGTIGLATIAADSLLGNSTGSSAVPSAVTYSTLITAFTGTTSGTLAAGNDSRFAGPNQNSQSTNYTFVLSDAGGQILHPAADTTARTFTIPANSAVAYAVGTKIEIVNQLSAGVITLGINTDTLTWYPGGTTGTRTIAAGALVELTKITATSWIVTGVGIT